LKVLLAFMFGVLLLSAWEVRGGPKWRTPVVVIACGLFALVFASKRLV